MSNKALNGHPQAHSGFKQWFASTWHAIRTSDIDSVLSFDTPSVIRIRDRYLGAIYYISYFLIFLYIVVYEIWYKRGYLITESPQGGNVRVTVTLPHNITGVTQPSYCKLGSKCIFSSFGVNTDESFPFIPTKYIVKKVPFFFGDCIEPSTMATNPRCAYTPEVEIKARETYFLSRAEDYHLTINHTVAGLLSSYTRNLHQMKGTLVDLKGKIIQKFESGQPADHYAISVSSLLKAANVGLDDEKGTVSNDARNKGVFLLVYINYMTINHLGALEFTMKVSSLLGENSPPEKTYFSNPFPVSNDKAKLPEAEASYTVIKMNGITLQIRQVGKIGTFNLQTLLINLVAGTALLRAAAIIVEFLMICVMPQRDVYRKYKYHETLDFGDYRHALRGGGDCHEMSVQKPAFHDNFPVLNSTPHTGSSVSSSIN